MSDEALDRRLSSGLGSVLGKVAQQVEPAAGHPRREVGLAQPAALSPPGAGHHSRPVLDAARVGIGRAEPVLVRGFIAVGLDGRTPMSWTSPVARSRTR